MKPSDFFREEQDSEWSTNGGDPWSVRLVFDEDLVVRLRRGPFDGGTDIEAAFGLAHLAQRELTAFGTDHSEKLDNDQMATVLRSMTVVLKRLGVAFDPPFRDFTGFHGYWSGQGMSGGGGWAARRGYVSELFAPIFSRLDALEDAETAPAYRGVDGKLKNIIFASTGPKPRIVLRDALNNVIEVVEGAEQCLFYDRPLADSGLSWDELVQWWRTAAGDMEGKTDTEVARHLYGRLAASLASEPEKLLFRSYCERYGSDGSHPALLPQVYLHYDPQTRKERDGRPGPLRRERMDFLLLLPHGIRVVLEVDGKQHYAEGDVASPRRYSEMVAEDRSLQLRGYEVFRFGGSELRTADAADKLRQFFNDLERRYGR
ncbi:hypothetical protein ABZS66_20970 [Dactylosporangium sp. NPDC005572]|uniref:hypothetical protein n=1 Tax=Dactylosporangium sp. NPDC005572 TaxID=3156889 RepID=UPI0033B92049